MAKLTSLRPVQFVGIALPLFGIASFVWPPLRVVVGSVTTSLVVTASGISLIALPVLLVGNEVLILLCGLGAAVGYFFVHRYGRKSGEVAVYKKWVDGNGDGKIQESEIL